MTSPGRTEVQQSRADVLALPGLIAVVLLAIVIRQLFTDSPSAIIVGVCAGVAVLDVPLARYFLRNGAATLVVTSSDITFTRPGAGANGSPPQAIQRTSGSRLSFRLQSAGFIGNQMRYVLKLRDDATGEEMSVTTFGRRRVRQACESQGWPFS